MSPQAPEMKTAQDETIHLADPNLTEIGNVATPETSKTKTESPKASTKKTGAAKGAAKAPAKKAEAKKTSAKPSANNGATKKAPPEKKSGLRKPQERILKALAKAADKTFTRNQIAAKADVDLASLVEYMGSHDDVKRKTNDQKHFTSLVSLGFVKFGPSQEEGGAVTYQISAKGKQMAEKLS